MMLHLIFHLDIPSDASDVALGRECFERQKSQRFEYFKGKESGYVVTKVKGRSSSLLDRP